MPQGKTVILGVGNLLLSDEGFGVHLANRLEKEPLPEGVEVVEGGTDGFHLINVIRAAGRLIVVDAIRGGEAPGTIYRFALEDAPGGRLPQLTSAHQVGILEVLELTALTSEVPETVFFGVEPESLEMGMELSECVAARIPRVIELIREELAGQDTAAVSGKGAAASPDGGSSPDEG
jgi:hydrogenase maturation protease